MKSWKTVVLVIVLVFAFTGCGNDSGGSAETANMAGQIEDEANKFNPRQTKCPVCGGTPIKADFYHDTNRGRIYFDKEECLNEFKQNPEEALRAYTDKLMQQRMQEEQQMRQRMREEAQKMQQGG